MRRLNFLRGLTLWQPMAWAISDLAAPEAKRIENRPWPPYKGVTHVAIHAGSKYHLPHQEQIEDLLGRPIPSRGELPQGAILAVARLAGYIHVDDAMLTQLAGMETDPWFSGPYGWVLADVVKLPEPIPYKGSLGLWRLEPPVERRVWDIYREQKQDQDRMERGHVEPRPGM